MQASKKPFEQEDFTPSLSLYDSQESQTRDPAHVHLKNFHDVKISSNLPTFEGFLLI
jgi:hypothetical protein